LAVSTESARSLWAQFAQSRQGPPREDLIAHYLPLARIWAAKLYRVRVDDSVPFDDYLQYARLGLLEAIDRFDPAREASFETFSSYRIRGAILNGLGRESEVAAQRAQWCMLVRERIDSLHPQINRPAADLEDKLTQYFRQLFPDTRGDVPENQLQSAIRAGQAVIAVHPRGQIETDRAIQTLGETHRLHGHRRVTGWVVQKPPLDQRGGSQGQTER